MATYQRSTRWPPSDLTNLTISSSLKFVGNVEKSCSSIGSSMPQIYDEVVESQDRRKGRAVMSDLVNITHAVVKPKQINKRKPHKENQYARTLVLAARQNNKKVSGPKLVPLQDYIKKQKAYFAEIDAFELDEEEVSASELE